MNPPCYINSARSNGLSNPIYRVLLRSPEIDLRAIWRNLVVVLIG
jgi:hypothetical protein